MAKMCVAMVIIHTKTLEKKAVDDVTSKESLQLVRNGTSLSLKAEMDGCIIYPQ